MQFTSVQDVNAPLEFVFEQLSDFESYEAYAMRVGAQVERRDTLTETCAGMMWYFEGDIRGKTRHVDIELTNYAPPKDLKFICTSPSMEARVNVQAMELAKQQSRIKTVVDAKALNMSARLILQSARLAKASLNRRFNHRVWEFANYIEDNYTKSQGI